jgi:hypothetical protein
MLGHMRALSPIFTVFLLLMLLLGCSAPHHQTTSEPPAIVIHQLPDYPMPGRDSDFPGGLVAALWRDGRLIRATDIGKSYVEGVVPRVQREQFFSFLGTAVGDAPKIDGIPLHVATQSITVRSDGRTTDWTRILPDTDSVWSNVQSQLLRLPLQNSHTLDSAEVESLR